MPKPDACWAARGQFRHCCSSFFQQLDANFLTFDTRLYSSVYVSVYQRLVAYLPSSLEIDTEQDLVTQSCSSTIMVLTSLPVLWQNIPAESNLHKRGLTMAPSLSWWENQGSGNLRGLVLSHPLSGSKELWREPQFAFSIYTVHDPCTKQWCSPQSGGLPASINAIRIMPTRIRRGLSPW